MGAVVCAWKAHAARQAQLSSLTADIVAKQRKRLSATAFAGWRQRVSRKKANKAKVRLCCISQTYQHLSDCRVYPVQKIAKLRPGLAMQSLFSDLASICALMTQILVQQGVCHPTQADHLVAAASITCKQTTSWQNAYRQNHSKHAVGTMPVGKMQASMLLA